MARKIGPVDLFGRPVRVRRTRSQIELERHDRETVTGRIARLNYVKRVHPVGGFGMPIESVMLFTEAKMAVVDGLFVSGLLLCKCFIGHVLASRLETRGFRRQAKAGWQRKLPTPGRSACWTSSGWRRPTGCARSAIPSCT